MPAVALAVVPAGTPAVAPCVLTPEVNTPTVSTPAITMPEVSSTALTPIAAAPAISVPAFALPEVVPAVLTTAVATPVVSIPAATVPAALVPDAVHDMPEIGSLNKDALFYNSLRYLVAEVIRLQKQRDIIKLQNEINNLSSAGGSFRIDISAIESMVPKFAGEDHYDIKKWLNDFEDALDVLRFDERAKLIGCRRLIDGTAKMFLRTVTAPCYLVLKQLLIEEFCRHRNLQEVYKELANHKYKSGDNLKRYVLEMQEIATQASIPEDELIDFILLGINDQTNSGSMLFAATTIKELKVLLERYERYQQKPARMVTKPSVP